MEVPLNVVVAYHIAYPVVSMWPVRVILLVTVETEVWLNVNVEAGTLVVITCISIASYPAVFIVATVEEERFAMLNTAEGPTTH